MNLYSIPMTVYATAYIRAETPEAAMEIAEGLTDLSIEEVEVSGLQFDDPDLPDISFSPAMTIGEPEHGIEPELAE